MRKLLQAVALLLLCHFQAQAQQPAATSTAGFFKVVNGGREVFSFNQGWRFYKGNATNASTIGFDDQSWETVNLPHGLELLPTEASGGVNYQGPSWYRKWFTLPSNLKGQRIVLYFEGVMGKSTIWINGKEVKQHFGGYLPIPVDVTDAIRFDGENLIAVYADNSNDPIYPPGKPQEQLDFCYFGGIYRDVWLYTTNSIFITDPNMVDKEAGGGLFTRIDELNNNEALISTNVDIQNSFKRNENVDIKIKIADAKGNIVSESRQRIKLGSQASNVATIKTKVPQPNTWSPESPYLYHLICEVSQKGKVIDAIMQRVGIRTIELRAKEGLILNGKPYTDKLIGGNRHQDYAYVGNALPNSGQWRDAQLLRSAGMRIIRSAHYPLDPAFMDAADELGLFVIVATPGWQFWNEAPEFEARVYNDIRQMVRRDRNRPSVFMWEPILNETWYPGYFAKKVHDLVHTENPYKGVYTACDREARGSEHFDVLFNQPFLSQNKSRILVPNENQGSPKGNPYDAINKPMFNREWGDNVDNWNAHNSPSRVDKAWGEMPMLIQAQHYTMTAYPYTNFQTLYQAPPQMLGGTLWHPFDHQRGYHPDPFYGGILDAFRQPKTSYYLFKSQSDHKVKIEAVDGGPMIYIANEMTPFSPHDVTVYTNCDEVRLIVNGSDTLMKKIERIDGGMPHPPAVFSDAFDFMMVKQLNRSDKGNMAKLEAQGIIDGKVVVTQVKMPTYRPEKVMLSLADHHHPLVADGSDFIPVIASITDKDGNVKRLNGYSIQFEVEGQGQIIGDESIEANPRRVEWGTAPALIRSTTQAGKIVVRASVRWPGSNMPTSTTLEFESVPAALPAIASSRANERMEIIKSSNNKDSELKELKDKLQKVQQELNQIKNKEVEKQQTDFE